LSGELFNVVNIAR